MVLSLPGSPTEKEEHAYYWWVKKYGDARCNYCGSVIQLDHELNLDVEQNLYCSHECYHMHYSTTKFEEGRI